VIAVAPIMMTTSPAATAPSTSATPMHLGNNPGSATGPAIAAAGRPCTTNNTAFDLIVVLSGFVDWRAPKSTGGFLGRGGQDSRGVEGRRSSSLSRT
jgi:hypothetical protein